MNRQEREEIAELILRAFAMKYRVGVTDASSRVSLWETLTLQDNAHTAEREVWEALYRVRLDERSQRDERTDGTELHERNNDV